LALADETASNSEHKLQPTPAPVVDPSCGFWVGGLRANIVVIVRAGWFKIRVFNLYDAFQAAQHGKPEELTRSIERMLALSQASGEQRGWNHCNVFQHDR
jgi:hypothetical protein